MQIEPIMCQGLSFRYGDHEVLSDISFTVNRGDYVGLVGPNGSGKSTLIRIILGLLRPLTGRVMVFGADPSERKLRDRLGYLPQKMASFNPHFPSSVREIVSLGLISGRRFPKSLGRDDHIAIDKALDLMNISGISRSLIGDLSGGQQQRVFLARALVNGPELLVLDEPTTALDPETRQNFFTLLAELNRTGKVTVVLVTHDIGSIGKYASRLLYIDKSVVFYGGFDEFCLSGDMGKFFGESSQHLICHRHE
ncbi:MAG: metal ABC transporter ATP-binding protein [Nitrospirae bacterium]|nr:metal ABC transporter ATP-binding protein [Nitrospirota bacterium]